LSFVRSILTPPGGIPKLGQWADTKLLCVAPEDEKKIRKLMRPPSRKHRQHAHQNSHSSSNLSHDEEQGGRDEELDHETVKQFLRRLLVVERKADGSLRYCKDDQFYKPDRCHHCSVCQECVLRMDHHCPWISNCVGYGNYKYFMLVLFYGMLCSGFLLGALLPRLISVFEPITSNKLFMRYDLPIGIAYGASAIIFVALTVFFFFHIWLTLHAMTTIEYREKWNHDDAEVRRRFQVAHTKFDKGYYHNFTDVFGPAYMWLLPIEADVQPDGTYSDVFCSTWDDVVQSSTLPRN